MSEKKVWSEEEIEDIKNRIMENLEQVIDPELGIDWGVSEPIISEKDKIWPTIQEFKERTGGGL